MNKQTEAMKLAQEWYDSGNENPDDFADMIKQVIALAEQTAPMIRGDIRDGLVDDEPAQRTWVGLTDEDIASLDLSAVTVKDAISDVRAVEIKLREKNGITKEQT